MLEIPIWKGHYEFSMDLAKLTTSCDLSAGLTCEYWTDTAACGDIKLFIYILSYLTDHIHSYWTDVERSSTTSCADAGGHYDPYLACGTSSEEKAGACVQLSRTVAQNYTYACSAANYAAGYYNLCEVGDLSGKFGRAMPTAGSLVFKVKATLTWTSNNKKSS